MLPSANRHARRATAPVAIDLITAAIKAHARASGANTQSPSADGSNSPVTLTD